MEKGKLIDAMEEANRFLKKAGGALKRLEDDKYASISGSKETGACRRASLDLTRSLARLRKP